MLGEVSEGALLEGRVCEGATIDGCVLCGIVCCEEEEEDVEGEGFCCGGSCGVNLLRRCRALFLLNAGFVVGGRKGGTEGCCEGTVGVFVICLEWTVPGEAGEGVLVGRGGGVVCKGTPLGVVGDCWAKLRHWITRVFILFARDLSGMFRRTWLMYFPSLVL